ncbi:Transcriptional activator HlyU [Methylocella tundrae]|nr:Transcriptional activator HlyU [Methylocella tundrae]
MTHKTDKPNLVKMNLDEFASRAGNAETFLKALANRHRLMILCELHKGEQSVGVLHEAIGLSQSALSQHLARLREDDLVRTRRESQTIYYSLASEEAQQVIALLYNLFCSPGCK